ncbi:MAG: hypothetical protein KF906_11050 [Actinobacteria bacterium]|nr:hypothetical protein [Actinomycetota bacterium]
MGGAGGPMSGGTGGWKTEWTRLLPIVVFVVGSILLLSGFLTPVFAFIDAAPTRLFFAVPAALIGTVVLRGWRADAAARADTTGPDGVSIAVEHVVAAPFDPPTWVGDGTLLGSPVLSVNRLDRFRADLGGASVYDGSGRHLADVVPGAPSLHHTIFIDDPAGRPLLRVDRHPNPFGTSLTVFAPDGRTLGEARQKRLDRETYRLVGAGGPIATMRPPGSGRPRRIVDPSNRVELARVFRNPGQGVLASNPARSWVVRFERHEPPEVQAVIVASLLAVETGFRR